jgi:hypothetical protein
MFDHWELQNLPGLLRFLRIADRADYTISLLVSDHPMLDGYLTCLVFRQARHDQQPAPLGEIAEAFIQSELVREPTIERWMPDFDTGARRPDTLENRILWHFDGGSGDLGMGFGLLVDDAGSVRLWSRPVHHHK